MGKWLNEEDYEWTETDKKSRIDGSSIRKWREKGGKALARSVISGLITIIPNIK